jgi:hypothetical protein
VVAAVGRVRSLWITARVTMFNETTGVPLMALCYNWNSMGIIVNIGEKF